MSDTRFDNRGRLDTRTLGVGAGSVLRDYDWDSLSRLSRLRATHSAGTVVQDQSYSWDSESNLTQILDNDAGGVNPGGGQRQCFSYDVRDRLIGAWTVAGGCGGQPATGGGVEAYSEAWSFDEVGNMVTARKSVGAAAATTTSYTYPQPGSARPHAPTGTATASNQGEYVPLSVPARVMDTRYGVGQCDGPAYPCTTMASGAGRELRLHGLGGLPANDADGVQRKMSAVAISVTSVGSTGAGYIQMWPHGETAIYTSLLNYELQPVSNTAIVTMSWNGEIVVYNYGAQTDLVVDVLGYYSTTNGADGGTFKPLVGGRAVDTCPASRTGLCADYTSQCTGLANNEVRSIRLTGRGGVPVSNVAAVAGNFTVANLTGGGFLRVWAAGDPEPGTSNMNFTPSYANSQFAVVKVPPSGVVNVRVVGSVADVIIDTQGFFTTPGNSTWATETQAFTSARIVDTRWGTALCAGSPTGALGACPPMFVNNGRYIQITGQGGVPADAVAVTLNITFLGEGILGAGTVWAADQPYPATTSMILRPGDHREHGDGETFCQWADRVQR